MVVLGGLKYFFFQYLIFVNIPLLEGGSSGDFPLGFCDVLNLDINLSFVRGAESIFALFLKIIWLNLTMEGRYNKYILFSIVNSKEDIF